MCVVEFCGPAIESEWHNGSLGEITSWEGTIHWTLFDTGQQRQAELGNERE